MTEIVSFARRPELSNSRSYMGNIMSFLLNGSETGGCFAIVEALSRVGTEPPPHFHEWEDEIYFVLEGEAEFFLEDRTDSLRVKPGEIVFIPKGKPMPSTSMLNCLRLC